MIPFFGNNDARTILLCFAHALSCLVLSCPCHVHAMSMLLGLYYCTLPCLVMPCIVMPMPCPCYVHAMLCHTLAVCIPAALWLYSCQCPTYHCNILLSFSWPSGLSQWTHLVKHLVLAGYSEYFIIRIFVLEVNWTKKYLCRSKQNLMSTKLVT